MPKCFEQINVKVCSKQNVQKEAYNIASRLVFVSIFPIVQIFECLLGYSL